jgi:anaerobic ribonucleoside-triphosphate reductase activating protein
LIIKYTREHKKATILFEDIFREGIEKYDDCNLEQTIKQACSQELLIKGQKKVREQFLQETNGEISKNLQDLLVVFKTILSRTIMNIAHIEEQSFIYGPGCRFVVWVQGCSIRCKGCWNREMWSFENNIILSVNDLVHKIRDELDFIEGITLLGGEPLDQFAEILELLQKCRELGLTTMLFTGYEMEEINDKGISVILDFTDILITGRYEESKRTINRQWIGSTNQQIHFLTKRYKDFQIENANYVELTLEENGKCTILGFP